MFESIKNMIKLLFIVLFGFLLVSIFLAIFLYAFASLPNIDLIFGKLEKAHDVAENILRIHAAAIIILTIVLICVGWLQLGQLNQTSKAEFLLQITNRYGSSEIIKAREIIQRLYREACPPNEKVAREIYFQRIADSIDQIRNDINKSDDFSHLLNLLDFLEILGYFTRKKYITVKDVDELIGNSLVFYFNIFKQWIYYRRRTYDNDSYYCEFQTLVETIESYQAKEKLAKNCFLIRLLNYFY